MNRRKTQRFQKGLAVMAARNFVVCAHDASLVFSIHVKLVMHEKVLLLHLMIASLTQRTPKLNSHRSIPLSQHSLTPKKIMIKAIRMLSPTMKSIKYTSNAQVDGDHKASRRKR